MLFDLLETFLFRRGMKAQEEKEMQAFFEGTMAQLADLEGPEAVAYGRAWASERNDLLGGLAAAEAFGRVMNADTEAYVVRRREELRQVFLRLSRG
jgi:hypothetical protein